MAFDKTAKKISDSYMVFLWIAVVIMVFTVSLELAGSVFSNVNGYGLYLFAQGLGIAGVVLALTAAAFFPIRKIGVNLKDRYKFTSAPAYRQLMKVTALLHPVIALLAFCLLFIHGFIFLTVIYQFEFVPFIAMGAAALSAITLLFLSGTFLKRKLSRKRLRTVHFSLALIFICLIILHLLVR